MANQSMTRRTFAKGSLAASALAALAACGKNNTAASGSGSGATTAAAGNVFNFYINDPVAIDPYNTQESEGTQVEYELFDSLVNYDFEKGEVVPAACESFEVNETGDEFTFHLVKGAKFHNGDPVDAESFKRGWQRLLDPKMATPSEIGYHLDPVEGAAEYAAGDADEVTGLTCPDENTFVVKLTAPMADFAYVCCHPALAPVPQAAIDDPDSFLLAPIGNGPFKMDGKWESGQYIDLLKFDDYYGDDPKLDGIHFSIQKDPNTAFNEFKAGNIDFTSIPTGKFADVEKEYGESEDGYTVTPGKQTLKGAESSVYYLAVNLEDEAMKDVNLRRALSLAINRQNIVDTLFEGTRQPATGMFPPAIDDDEADVWEYSKYDPDQAKEILDQYYPADADGKRGIKVTLNYNSGGGHEDIMTSIQADFEAVGIEVEQSGEEWAAYLTDLGDGNFQLGRLGWIADYPTMDNFMYPNFFSTADNNYSKYNNPEVDEKILAARQITDDEERKAAYREITHLIGEDMPVIPVMFYAHDHVGSNRVKEMYYDTQGKAHLYKAELDA